MSRLESIRAALKLDRGFGGLLCLLPALSLILLFYAFPILRLLGISVGEDDNPLSAYAILFDQWSFHEILLRTFRVGAAVVAVCFVFGYPIGYVLAFSTPRNRLILSILVVLPFWTSVLVRNFSWVFLLRQDGILNDLLNFLIPGQVDLRLLYNESGVVIGMANTLLPFMIFPIYVALASQKRVLREAAASLGATPFQVFLSVTLRLSRSGIAAGSLLVFSTAIGFFITPALLGGGRVLTAATFIDQQVEEFINWQVASAAAIVLLAAVLVTVILFNRYVEAMPVGGHANTD